MKTLAYVIPFLSIFLLVAASPLGDRNLFARHEHGSITGRDVRRFVLRSDLQAPAACASKVSSPAPAPFVPKASTQKPPTPKPSTRKAPKPLPSTKPIVGNKTSGKTIVSNSTSTGNTTSVNATAGGKRHFESEFSIGSSESTSIISQTISVEGFDFTEYSEFCRISGGNIGSLDEFSEYSGLECINWAGIDAVGALYAEADVCEQQRNADFMISWAHAHGGARTHQLIEQAISYRRHPRKVVEILGIYPATPYCLETPLNFELHGVWNAQLPHVTYGIYGGPSFPLVSFGNHGSCPFGMMPSVTTCSCLTSIYDAAGNTTSSESTASDSSSDDTDETDDNTSIDTDTSTTDTASAADTSSTGASPTDLSNATDSSASGVAETVASSTTVAAAAETDDPEAGRRR